MFLRERSPFMDRGSDAGSDGCIARRVPPSLSRSQLIDSTQPRVDESRSVFVQIVLEPRSDSSAIASSAERKMDKPSPRIAANGKENQSTVN